MSTKRRVDAAVTTSSVVVAALAVALLAGCTTQLAGNGTRAGATGFPSTSPGAGGSSSGGSSSGGSGSGGSGSGGSGSGGSGSGGTSSSGGSPSASSTAADPVGLLQAAVDASNAVGTLHMTGTLKADGVDLGLDINYGASVAVGNETSPDGGGTAAIMHASDKNFYVKGDPTFLAAQGLGASQIAAIGGRWIKPGDGTGSFTTLLVRSKFLGLITEGLTAGGVLLGDTSTVAGHQVVAIVDRASSADTLYVDTTSKLPVQFLEPSSGTTLNFVTSDTPLDVPPPGPSEIYG